MRLMKKLIFVTILFLSLVPFLRSNEEVKEVVAEGQAEITNNNVESAKAAALLDAKRNAVDQVGSEVLSETVVSNYQLVRDKIISRVSGYVHSYKIIDEGKKGNSYYVKIRAKVSATSLKNDARMIYSEMKKPRVVIVVQEIRNGKTQLSSQGENALVGFFRDKYFQVLDASKIKEKIRRSKMRVLTEGMEKEAAKLGYRIGAEVVITGQAIVSNPAPVQGILFAAKSTVTLRAIDAASGSIYAVATVEGRGIDAVREGAVRKAIENGAKDAAKKIFWKIVKMWNSQVLNRRSIELTVRGVNYRRLKTLIKKLRKVKGVKEVIKRSFDNPVAVLDVTFLGDSDRLADLLDGLKIGLKKVTINEVTSSGIEILLK